MQHQLLTFETLYTKMPEILQAGRSALESGNFRESMASNNEIPQNPVFFKALEEYFKLGLIKNIDEKNPSEEEKRDIANFILIYMKNFYLEHLINREKDEKKRETDLQDMKDGKLVLLMVKDGEGKGHLTYAHNNNPNPEKYDEIYNEEIPNSPDGIFPVGNSTGQANSNDQNNDNVETQNFASQDINVQTPFMASRKENASSHKNVDAIRESPQDVNINNASQDINVQTPFMASSRATQMASPRENVGAVLEPTQDRPARKRFSKIDQSTNDIPNFKKGKNLEQQVRPFEEPKEEKGQSKPQEQGLRSRIQPKEDQKREERRTITRRSSPGKKKWSLMKKLAVFFGGGTVVVPPVAAAVMTTNPETTQEIAKTIHNFISFLQ